jgi:hypothetical protein
MLRIGFLACAFAPAGFGAQVARNDTEAEGSLCFHLSALSFQLLYCALRLEHIPALRIQWPIVNHQ